MKYSSLEQPGAPCRSKRMKTSSRRALRAPTWPGWVQLPAQLQAWWSEGPRASPLWARPQLARRREEEGRHTELTLLVAPSSFHWAFLKGKSVANLNVCSISLNVLMSIQFSSIQSLNWLFATPWTAACQASLSFTVFRSLLKLMSIESEMPSNHLILCHPFSSRLQSFPASGSLPMSQIFTSGGQSIKIITPYAECYGCNWQPRALPVGGAHSSKEERWQSVREMRLINF